MTTRKSYAGGAVSTTISSGAFNVGATTLTLNATTGWPTTVNGPFVAIIDRGLATSEKIKIGNRSGVTCTSITRGFDGTAEVSHASNAVIEHCLDAETLNEANLISSLLTAKGAQIGHDGTQVQPVPAGTAGYYYTATPAAATGNSWTAPPSSLVTAKGQVLAASASGALATTNTPTAGQVLLGDPTQTAGVRYGQFPVVRATRSAQQSIADNSIQDIIFDVENQDSDNLWAPTTADFFSGTQQGMWSVTFTLILTTYGTFGASTGDQMMIYESGGLGQVFTYYPKNANRGAPMAHYMHATIYKTTGAIRCGMVQVTGAATNVQAIVALTRISL